MTIIKTNNYDLFNCDLVGNRQINLNHVRKLKTILSKNNKNSIIPLIINNEYQIVDGQHRFQALKELNLPIYYIIDSNATIKTASQFNSTAKGWGFNDYLNSYISQGKQQYILFNEIKTRYNLKNNTCLKITSNNNIQDFRDGNLKLKNYRYVTQFAETFSKTINYFQGGRESILVDGLKIALKNPNFNRTKFVAKLDEIKEPLLIPQHVKEITRLIEDIYNRKLHKVNKLRLD